MSRKGDQFGRWTLVESLGGGGNGEVWCCRDADGAEAAIKLLRRDRRSRSRIGRFRDEIRFLLSAEGSDEGVLAVTDSHLPDDEGADPWFVMPLARTLPEALGPDPDLDSVVGALAEIAKTLARLHERGVGHRDLKPDNLFEKDGCWLVGDFGLVSYPDKDARTEHGRRLGAVDYLAPEMRSDADTADAGPADVYSLAKVLWVLATGRDLPLPGPHRADDPAYALATYIEAERLLYLDRLIERATTTGPAARPSMAEFADELERWSAVPLEPERIPDLGETLERLSAIGEVGKRAEERTATRDTTASESFRAWTKEALDPIHEQLAGIDGAAVGTGHSHAIHPMFLSETDGRELCDQFSMATSLRLAGVDLELHCAIGMQYFGDDAAKVAAGFFMQPPQVGGGLWTGSGEGALGSLALEGAMSALGAELQSLLPDALATYMARIDG